MSKQSDEEFKNNYMNLKQICDNAINNIKNNDFKKIIDEQKICYINNKRFQYDHIIYYYRVLFNKDFLNETKNKTIVGFHIMPYQITENDIKNANIISNNPKFCDIATPENNYIDYDNNLLKDKKSISGNFHKYPNNKYQIVLLEKSTKEYQHYGPNYLSNKMIFNKDNANEYIKQLKEDHVYFPNILNKEIDIKASKNNTKELEDLIIEAFNSLKEK